jgi:hypothetical protein
MSYRRCRELALRLYTLITDLRYFAFETLPQLEKLIAMQGIPESVKTQISDLSKFQNNYPELSENRFNELKREIYRASDSDNCHELLKDIAMQESKLILIILAYSRMVIQFNRSSVIKKDPKDMESTQGKYDQSIADIDELASELGLQQPTA